MSIKLTTPEICELAQALGAQLGQNEYLYEQMKAGRREHTGEWIETTRSLIGKLAGHFFMTQQHPNFEAAARNAANFEKIMLKKTEGKSK